MTEECVKIILLNEFERHFKMFANVWLTEKDSAERLEHLTKLYNSIKNNEPTEHSPLYDELIIQTMKENRKEIRENNHRFDVLIEKIEHLGWQICISDVFQITLIVSMLTLIIRFLK